MTDEKRHCLNCDAILAGEYCHQCGQRAGRREVTFSGLLAEIADELFSWDSRLWRTLIPLLFRPGFLSAEYMAGHRARYVPPLRLYLIISFLLFLVLQQAGNSVIQISVEQPAATADATSGEGPLVSGDAGTISAAPSASPEDEPTIVITDENSPDWLRRLEGHMQENARKFNRDPQSFVAKALDYLPQIMFLLLPLFALLIRVAYLLSPFHYLQHVVFSLHFHSFAYLMYLLGAALERFTLNADGLLFGLLMVYLSLALKRAYGSGLMAAIGKSLAIQFAYALLLGIGLAGAFLAALSLS
jgi:hypothetical protein